MQLEFLIVQKCRLIDIDGISKNIPYEASSPALSLFIKDVALPNHSRNADD